jgi:hypothetical protein
MSEPSKRARNMKIPANHAVAFFQVTSALTPNAVSPPPPPKALASPPVSPRWMSTMSMSRKQTRR